MARNRRTAEPPHIRIIAPSAKHRYIGRLTYTEFDIIDMFRNDCDARDATQIALRMGSSQSTTERLTHDWNTNLLFERVYDGRLQSDVVSTQRATKAWGNDFEFDRVCTTLAEDKWLPTPYAYDQWHLSLGEDPNDPRHQYAYGNLAAVRAVWEARYVERARERDQDTRPRAKRRTIAFGA